MLHAHLAAEDGDQRRSVKREMPIKGCISGHLFF